MVVYPLFAWRCNEGLPFCTRNMSYLSCCSKFCFLFASLSPVSCSFLKKRSVYAFPCDCKVRLYYLLIFQTSISVCFFCVAYQASKQSSRNTHKAFSLKLAYAMMSTEPWGGLMLLRFFVFEYWTICIVCLFPYCYFLPFYRFFRLHNFFFFLSGTVFVLTQRAVGSLIMWNMNENHICIWHSI